MLRELLAGIVGLCGGMVVATALAAFIIGLGMIPRYAGVTHTGNHLLIWDFSGKLGDCAWRSRECICNYGKKSRSYERCRTGYFIDCSWKGTWKSGSVFLLKIKKRIVSLGKSGEAFYRIKNL